MTTTDTSITRVIIHGAGGRMGARLCAIASSDARYRLIGAIVRAQSPLIGRAAQTAQDAEDRVMFAAGSSTIADADAVIDFSSDDALPAAIDLAKRAGAALVVGTTALSERSMTRLREASATRAVLVASNMSVGVRVLSALLANAARALDESYECSIVEAHHRAKKDAPSGTALRLAQAVRGAGHSLRDEQILSIRGGDVVGEHTVRFAGPGEYLEFTHRATSRDVFARGALRAAAWLKGRPPGWYTIDQLVPVV
jgi:4-hydroxy-tetrahydrodipicolinate reductase